ncbi:MAG TPA: hypothetical protein VGB45_11775 [Abditibacterium sp.]
MNCCAPSLVSPPTQPSAQNGEARSALWSTAAALVLALIFSFYYLHHTFVMNEADPRLLAEFRGHRPYQARVLMPVLIHFGVRWTTLDVARCYQILLIGFSMGLFTVFKIYLGQFCAPRAARWLALVLIWPLFAFYSHKWFYLYDVPAVFFATLGLLLMAQKRWKLYLLVFTLATLNRESSAFLVLACVLTSWKTVPRRAFLSILAAQIGIWLGVRALTMWLFAGNAGQSFELHWAYNLASARQLLTSPWPLTLGSAIVTFVFLWVLGALTQRAQPDFLRRTRGVVWPFLALMSVVGVMSETRLYSELIPFLLAPALVGTFNVISQRLS